MNMYLPPATSASNLARTPSSRPAIPGVPFGQPVVGQVTVTAGLVEFLGPAASEITIGNRTNKPTAVVHKAFLLINFCLHITVTRPTRTWRQSDGLSVSSGTVTVPQNQSLGHLAQSVNGIRHLGPKRRHHVATDLNSR